MIVVRIWEGLGNQMFQYAYAKSLQVHTTNKVYLEDSRIWRNFLPDEDFRVERESLLSQFNISLPFVQQKELCRWNYIKRETEHDKTKYNLNEIGIGKNRFITERIVNSICKDVYDDGNYYLMGHYMNYYYAGDIREYLLKEFTLKEDILLPEWLENVLKERETVSVHIRRSDYLNHKTFSIRTQYLFVSDFYGRAMDYISQKKRSPVFLFFSDDIEWVKENIPCQKEHYYISQLGFRDYQELSIMAQCKNHIIPNSTFSYWGAWLCQNPDKIVVVTSQMPLPMIPENWIIMI